MPSSTSRRAPCIFFPMGRCGKGDGCNFSHDIQPSQKPSMPSRSECEHSLVGICRECYFTVDKPAEELAEPVISRVGSPSNGSSQNLTIVTESPSSNNDTGTSNVVKRLDWAEDVDQIDNPEDASYSEEEIPAHADDIWSNAHQESARPDAKLDHQSHPEPSENGTPVYNDLENLDANDTPELSPSSADDDNFSPSEASSNQDDAETEGAEMLAEEMTDNVPFHDAKVDADEELLDTQSCQTAPDKTSSEGHPHASYDENEGLSSHLDSTIPPGQTVMPHWSEHADPLADFMIPFCRFFAQGRCTQSEACRFRHSLSVNEYSLLFHDAQPPLWNFSAPAVQAGDVKMATVSPFNVCKFYPLGKCRNSSACPYLHVPSTDLLSILPEQPPEHYDDQEGGYAPGPPEPEQTLCKYYAKSGTCGRGDQCHFRHEAASLQRPYGGALEGDVETDDGGQEGSGGYQNAGQIQRALCKWFLEGHCQWGDKCKFSHVSNNVEEAGVSERSGSTSLAMPAPTEDGWDPGAAGWDDPVDEWAATKAPNAVSESKPSYYSQNAGVVGVALSGSGRPTAQKQPAGQMQRPCRWFLEGCCRWGDKCRFLHESLSAEEAASTESSRPAPTEQLTLTSEVSENLDAAEWGDPVDEWTAQKTPDTTDNNKTSCDPYSVVEAGNTPTGSGRPTPTNQHRSQIQRTQCKRFLEGHCRWGDKCNFLHESRTMEEPPTVPLVPTSTGDSWDQDANKWDDHIDEWTTKRAPDTVEQTRKSSKAVEEDDHTSGFVAKIGVDGDGAWTLGDVPNVGWDDYVDEWATNGSASSNKWDERIGERAAKETTHASNPYVVDKERYQGPGAGRRSICRFYAEGHCKKGARCDRSHDLPRSTSEGGNLSIMTSLAPSRSYSRQPSPVPNDVQANTMPDEAPQGTTVTTPPLVDGQLHDTEPNSEHVPWAVPPTPVCNFFVRGHCKFGDRCHLRHEVPPSSVTTTPSEIIADTGIEIEHALNTVKEQGPVAKDDLPLVTGEYTTARESTSREPEEAIPRSSEDDEKTWEEEWPKKTPAILVPVKIQAPCKAFGQGHCELGEACHYLHITDASEDLERSSTPIKSDYEDVAEIQQTQTNEPEPPQIEPELAVERELFGCTVRFGLDNGCSPTSIRAASDAFYVIVSNLPTDMSYAEAIELADTVNVGRGDENVMLETLAGGIDVIMKFSEPLNAVEAATRLHRQTYDSRPLTARLATEIIVSPLECRTVKITWPSPSRSAWAYYPTVSIAKSNEQRLNGAIFQGRKIKAMFSRPRANDTAYTVKISSLLVDVDRPALEDLAQAMVIHMNAPTYVDSPLDNIRNKLAQRGSLESFHQVPLDPTRPKHTAFARFHTGLSSVMSEHGKPCQFLGDGESLSLEKIFYANYKVSTRRYQAVGVIMEQLGEAHQEHCNMRIYSSGEPVDIHLYADAESGAAFGQANRQVQEALRGEVLTHEGKSMPAWDEYFELSSSTRAIEKINNDRSFFIKVDTRRQRVYILGDETNRKRARGIVWKLLSMVRAQRHILPLDLRALRLLIDGGYKALLDELGTNKVMLDIAVPQLIVRGDADVRKAQSRLAASASPETHNDGHALADDGASESFLCPVCRRPPRETVKLSCKHAYCTACLQHSLNSLTQVTPLRCLVGCEEYIPYIIVRDVLPTVSEAALLKNAFLFHVRKRPDEFFFCPLPHCETVFRPLSADRQGGLAMVYVCPTCSTKVCAICQSEYHEGWDCTAQPAIAMDP